MLKVDNIDVYYGAIHAIKGISIEVPKGEIVTLVGSNGAGKSTTLRTISGLMKPKNGTILFEDKNIVGVPAHKIVGMGLCQVPEGRHVFANMSVMENLELGAYLRNDKDGIARDLEDVFAALAYDSALLVAEAIKNAGDTDPVKIAQSMAKINGFQGVSGTVTFDAQHNPVKSAVIIEHKDGAQTFRTKINP